MSPTMATLDDGRDRDDRGAMRHRPESRLLSRFVAAAATSAIGLVGCTSPPPPASNAPARIVAPTDRPIASIEGASVRLGEVSEPLLEAAGALIVRERALDRAVAREATRRGIEVEEAAIAAERSILVRALSEDPDRAERLLEELRIARGLGPVRFAALLRRNALLRALVAEDVVVAEETVRGAWDAVHGPTRVSRVIALEDLRDAARVRDRLIEGEDFATLAVAMSVDPSGPRGGTLGPVSRLDPAWPAVFRETIFDLEPGRISNPLPVDGRILLLEVLEERAGTGVAFEEDRPRAARAARVAAERLLMDRLARRLVPAGSIESISPALRWSLAPSEP